MREAREAVQLAIVLVVSVHQVLLSHAVSDASLFNQRWSSTPSLLRNSLVNDPFASRPVLMNGTIAKRPLTDETFQGQHPLLSTLTGVETTTTDRLTVSSNGASLAAACPTQAELLSERQAFISSSSAMSPSCVSNLLNVARNLSPVCRGKVSAHSHSFGEYNDQAASFSPTASRLQAAPVAAPQPTVITAPTGKKVDGKDLSDWKVERTMSQALHMATAEELERDPSVCVLGEDVGHYGGSYKVTKDLHYRYGNYRVMDTPICENTFTGMAVGAAMAGLRPVVEGMNMGFLLLAFNQISNNAGMVRYTSGGEFEVPLVIRGPGGIGRQLGPEHSQRLEAYLMAVPGLKLVACSTPYNARGLLKSAIRDNNPVVFFEHVLLYNLKEEIPLLPYSLPLNKAEVVREGRDITILSYSRMRHVAIEAANRLAKAGVSVEVVDLISLKPLDIDTIKQSVKKTHSCLILDESSRTGGIGGEIFTQVMENCADDLDNVPVRLASKDIPTPYNRFLEELTVVTPEDVINTVIWMVSTRTAAPPNPKLVIQTA